MASPTWYTPVTETLLTGGMGMVWSWLYLVRAHLMWVWLLYFPEITSCRGQIPTVSQRLHQLKHWGEDPNPPHPQTHTYTVHQDYT